MADVWEKDWSPAAVQHVVGRFTRRTWDPVTRKFDVQKVEATCRCCGATFEARCESGRVREKIAMFASLHVHPRRTKS